MAMERDKEREAELESTMYTNCLLLGLDPSVPGVSPGGFLSPRVGHFRHSNPRMGEQLLYFLLSSLRGPSQSAKDFDKVWPIFDSTQSRDFRKIVQGIISELESQGALPRSNSRVSSLATCCGPRFVELLWQLSVHALREVQRRTFPADVVLNPLPASLTEVSYSHAAVLIPVSKARIALERRKFLRNANIAVHKQATWSELAYEMTAEFRALCAEEAYLQQELEKLQELQKQAKLEGELWDDRVSNPSSQTSHLVSKTTCLWESLLARKSQHEILASGPIEDLIAHREHRYRISGASLRAAMDQSSQVRSSDVLSVGSSHMTPASVGREQIGFRHYSGSNESRADDKVGRVRPTVDVAEVLRRWTHALQRIHKQSLHLAKANDGEGPEIFQCASDVGASGHADSLAATLAEHRQHLVSIQGLINQLKEAIPAMQKSVSELTGEISSISSLVPLHEYNGRPTSPIKVQKGGTRELCTDDISDLSTKLSSIQLDTASSSPTLKLPHLFSLTPNSAGKGLRTPKRAVAASQASQAGHLAERKTGDNHHIHNLKKAVRGAALLRQSDDGEPMQKNTYDTSQHFFMPPSTNGIPHIGTDGLPNQQKQRLFISSPLHSENGSAIDRKSIGFAESTPDEIQSFLNESQGFDYENCMDELDDCGKGMFLHIDEDMGQVFSPPLLLETSFLTDAYEDLLTPLSETDTALMER